MNEHTLYRKVKGRYVPVAMERANYLPYGVWLIQEDSGCRSMRSVGWRLSGLPSLVDLQAMVKTMMLEDAIIEGIREAGACSPGMSITDIAKSIENAIYKELDDGNST